MTTPLPNGTRVRVTREGVIVAMVADRYRVEVGDSGTFLRAHEVEVLPPVDDRVKRS
jgi:hypothetical protein